MVSRGEKETKQEIKARAARDEFEGGVGHLTARSRDAGGRETDADGFGHSVICVADMATEDDGQAAFLDIQVAALLVEDGAAFDAAFRHSFPGGGGTETESGHSEFLTNPAAATELPSKRVGGRERDRGEIFLPHRSLVTFPIMQKQECSPSLAVAAL